MKHWGLLVALVLTCSACSGEIPAAPVTVTPKALPFGVMVIVSSTPLSATQTRVPPDPQRTVTITPTADAQNPDCPPPAGWQPYTVRSGDFLSIIARNFGSTTREIIAANCLTNPDNILVGQTLYVPPPVATNTPLPGATRPARG